MKVFLSWSGVRSHAMALAMHEWLPAVLQGVEPFLSSQSIAAGRPWSEDLRRAIKDTTIAVICLTPENMHSAWLNYEAGAIAERVGSAVVPWILDMPADALSASPLNSFQASTCDHDGTLRLVVAINQALQTPRRASVVEKAFEHGWPQLAESLSKLENLRPTTDLHASQRFDQLEALMWRIWRRMETDKAKEEPSEKQAKESPFENEDTTRSMSLRLGRD